MKTEQSFGEFVDKLLRTQGINSEKAWDIVNKKGLSGINAINYIKKMMETESGLKRLKSFKGY